MKVNYQFGLQADGNNSDRRPWLRELWMFGQFFRARAKIVYGHEWLGNFTMKAPTKPTLRQSISIKWIDVRIIGIQIRHVGSPNFNESCWDLTCATRGRRVFNGGAWPRCLLGPAPA